jgi:hypothetical protein
MKTATMTTTGHQNLSEEQAGVYNLIYSGDLPIYQKDANRNNYITNSSARYVLTSGHIPKHSLGTLQLTKKI